MIPAPTALKMVLPVCAEAGLTPDEFAEAVQHTMIKSAGLPNPLPAIEAGAAKVAPGIVPKLQGVGNWFRSNVFGSAERAGARAATEVAKDIAPAAAKATTKIGPEMVGSTVGGRPVLPASAKPAPFKPPVEPAPTAPSVQAPPVKPTPPPVEPVPPPAAPPPSPPPRAGAEAGTAAAPKPRSWLNPDVGQLAGTAARWSGQGGRYLQDSRPASWAVNKGIDAARWLGNRVAGKAPEVAGAAPAAPSTLGRIGAGIANTTASVARGTGYVTDKVINVASGKGQLQNLMQGPTKLIPATAYGMAAGALPVAGAVARNQEITPSLLDEATRSPLAPLVSAAGRLGITDTRGTRLHDPATFASRNFRDVGSVIGNADDLVSPFRRLQVANRLQETGLGLDLAIDRKLDSIGARSGNTPITEAHNAAMAAQAFLLAANIVLLIRLEVNRRNCRSCTLRLSGASEIGLGLESFRGKSGRYGDHRSAWSGERSEAEESLYGCY